MTQEEKKIEIHKRVIEKLKENKISFTSIVTRFRENRLMRDGKTRRNVFTTNIREPLLGKVIFILSDPETLDILYVQTEVTRFMDVDEFFKLRERP